MANKKELSGNQLKLIAAGCMTIDHIGAYLFPQMRILKIIGRLAFPIFAYMIAQGCFYTKSRKKYFLNMSVLAIACQLVNFFVNNSLYQCILVTFSLSLLLIFSYDNAVKKGDSKSYLILLVTLFGAYFLTEILPIILKKTDYDIDYGFWGVMLPIFAFMGKDKFQKLIYFSAGVIMVAASLGGIQWFSVFSLPLLALYGGKRGKIKMKNFFYIYYPAHLAIIYLIGLVIGG